jgi:hypothetical protein
MNASLWRVERIERNKLSAYPWRAIGRNVETGERFDWSLPNLDSDLYDRASVEAAMAALLRRESGLVAPTITLGGSDLRAQLDVRCAAAATIEAAIRLLADVAPHGRDYIGDDESLGRDLRLHRTRLQELQATADRLRLEASTIMDLTTPS